MGWNSRNFSKSCCFSFDKIAFCPPRVNKWEWGAMVSDWGQFSRQRSLGNCIVFFTCPMASKPKNTFNEASGKCTKKPREWKQKFQHVLGVLMQKTPSVQKKPPDLPLSLKIMSVLCNFWPWTHPPSHIPKNKGYEGVKEHLETICFPLAWFNFCSFQCQQLLFSYFKNVGKRKKLKNHTSHICHT